MDSEVILTTDDAALQKVEMHQVYFSRHGKAFLKEDAARNDGATHNFCKCGNSKPKYNIFCTECEPVPEDRYMKKPFKEWDGKTPLVLFGDDQCFFDEDSLSDYCHDNEVKSTDLKLCICEPNHFYPVQSDYWEDIWPKEADELPDDVSKALDAFNAVLEKAKPFSWSEGIYRTTVELTTE